MLTSGLAEDESVTNVQHSGIDEGGIVKRHGDHLVVLRRGRLFTIAIGQDRLEPVDVIDAFAPGLDPEGTWYDEMLISGQTVVVVAFSYTRQTTELGLFDIDGAGHLRYRDTYQLRSGDYYSRSNYATRLVGTTLLMYTTSVLGRAADPLDSLPALRRWPDGAYDTIAPVGRVFRPARTSVAVLPQLHTLIACDLAAPSFGCEATVLIAESLQQFYVSRTAVYAWTRDWSTRDDLPSMLYQIPFNGAAIRAVQVTGWPINQLAFHESEDGYLNALVTQERGQVLLRLPLEALSDGSEAIPPSAYRALTGNEDLLSANRFVGGYLLFATSRVENGRMAGHTIHAAEWAGDKVVRLPVPHNTGQIEPMGRGAVAIGATATDFHVTSVALAGQPSVAGRVVREGAFQGETRSHGFFYRSEGPDAGVFGLPLSSGNSLGWTSARTVSAAILFVRQQQMVLHPLGELESDRAEEPDGCRASCVDWYGDARPLFIGDRVLALLGYEVVEGRIAGGAIEERRRVSFARLPMSTVQ